MDDIDSRFLEACDLPKSPAYTEPFAMVIFGGTGDLARRKLLPTLFALYREKMLSHRCHIIGASRRGLTDLQYRNFAREALERFGRKPLDRGQLSAFGKRLSYLRADAQDRATYERLCRRLTDLGKTSEIKSLVYYLAVPPDLIEPVITALDEYRMCGGVQRPKIVIEKPFGTDRASAARLNRFILRAFDDQQVYRIDHYLGKETVQNILFFRFGNSIFEPLWNRGYIDHVQITVAEEIGVEGRGRFYEQAGVVRDIVQNHLMQLLALVAMEPPVGFDADLIRDERVKAFRAIRPFEPEYIDNWVVRGQYGPGKIAGKTVCAYRQEPGVAADSNTPTFFAGKFHIDNWRWAGVHFYLRTGKRLASRLTEIYVQFKRPPLRLLGRTCDIVEPNSLVLSIQPRECMSLRLYVKRPGVGNRPHPVNMDFDYAKSFEMKTRPAYDRLILDCLKGDLTLFARADAIEAMWEIVDPIVEYWQSRPATDLPNYPAGSEGPAAAAQLLAADGRTWRKIQPGR